MVRSVLVVVWVVLVMSVMPVSAGSLEDETRAAERFVAAGFGADTVQPPFSFVYGGRPSSELLAGWTRAGSAERLPNGALQRTLTWTDPASGLRVTAEATTWPDFPAVEWVIRIANTGAADTPILENVQAADCLLGEAGATGDPILHYADGSTAIVTDFHPRELTLAAGVSKQFAPSGGRPSDGFMPFFNLEQPGLGGTMIAIGWTGQWAADISRAEGATVKLKAGMELTHLILHPGEEIRTPSVLLLFWSGDDALRGHNQLRRFIREHIAPQPGGKEVKMPLAASPHGIIAFEKSSEANCVEQIENIARNNMPIDTWWIDAGWYPCGDNWATGVGTWEPDPARYPNGMKPVADAAHRNGMRFLLWFEPERVMPGTWIYVNHPDWIMSPANLPDALAYQKSDGFHLLNLGNPEALAWLKQHVSDMIGSVGIDIYRQDFNMHPLYDWRNGEPEDRQGMGEIRYVTGMYDYLDTLQREHPDLLIDDCASGGRRIDFEMMKRAVVLTPSDYLWYPTGQQSMTYALSYWIPLHSIGGVSTDTYLFRSGMGAGYTAALDFFSKDPKYWDAARLLFEQERDLMELYKGDFYPLSRYNTDEDNWLAWQYDRPDLGRGVIQVFRRPDSPYLAMEAKLRGLDPEATYEVRDSDTGVVTKASGEALMKVGMTLKVGSRPGALLLTYRLIPK